MDSVDINSNPEDTSSRASFPQSVKSGINKKILLVIGAIIAVILIPLTFYIISSINTPQTVNNPANNANINAPYMQDQLIVKYKDTYTLDEINRLKSKLEEIGVVSQQKVFESDDPKLANYYLVKLKKGADVKKTVQQLSSFTEIENAGPNYIINTQETPNDPNFSSQWDLIKIGMPDAWPLAKGTSSIKVAVIDSGIDYNHSDLAGRVINGKDFSSCSSITANNECVPKARDNDSLDLVVGHGTHVAGTIGALTNNNQGVAGINWNVSMIAIKAVAPSAKSAGGPVTDIMDAVRYAADQGADVINMSLGAPVPCSSPMVVGFQEAIDYARAAGVVVISAAGNDNGNTLNSSPASCIGVITVGATDANDARASFSNWGERVDISAPGTNIISTFINGGYKSSQGTSMATPHVAGVAALLLSIKPNLSAQQVKDCLVNNGDSISTDRPIGRRLNALKTLSVCSGITPAVTEPPTQTPAQSQYQIKGVIFVDNNSNTLKDTGEQGIAAVSVGAQGGINRTGQTDATGNFTFADLTAGVYQISTSVNGVSLTAQVTLTASAPMWSVRFPIPPQFATPSPSAAAGAPSPTPIVVTPSPIVVLPSVSPPAQQTYSCRERTGSETRESIQIGDLVCTPN